MDLDTAIEQARRTKNLSLAELARLMGVTSHTLSNMRHARTDPRPQHVKALEDNLGWVEGTYWALRDDPTHTPQTAGVTADQLRMTGRHTSEHGTLTWVEQPGNLRDYTLSREILGTERGVSLPGSTLSPSQAFEDLLPALDLMQKLYEEEAALEE